MKITVIWNMAPCGQAEIYQHVGINRCLHVEGEERALRSGDSKFHQNGGT